MKEKINNLYKNKAPYYIKVLDEFQVNNIEFVLLNYIFPDENPGDIDIMVNEIEIKEIELILKNEGFEFYTEFNTNQKLWNKYVRNIGFIQFHLYVGLSFMKQTYFTKIPKDIDSKYQIDFHFFTFLVESFYRKKIKKAIYQNYLEKTSKSKLYNFVSLYTPQSKRFVDDVICHYENKPINSFLTYLHSGNKSLFKLFIYFFSKIYKKLTRINNNEDKLVFIIGVDGTGKSTLIKFTVCLKNLNLINMLKNTIINNIICSSPFF